MKNTHPNSHNVLAKRHRENTHGKKLYFYCNAINAQRKKNSKKLLPCLIKPKSGNASGIDKKISISFDKTYLISRYFFGIASLVEKIDRRSSGGMLRQQKTWLNLI